MIIDASGYRALWIVGGVSLLAGCGVALYLRAHIRRQRAQSDGASNRA